MAQSELTAAERKARRSNWVIRKFDSHEDLRRQQIRDWQEKSGAERREAAWELVEEYWVGSQGKTTDELRLQRTVARLLREEG